MPVPEDCHDAVTDAMYALTRACRQYGPETVRDALTEIRDTPDEDATGFETALLEAVAAAVAEAEEIEEGRTRIGILTPDGARLTWSWIGEARPDAEFENMVLTSVARALGRHVPDPGEPYEGEDGYEGEERLGTLTGPRGMTLRYRIGLHSGDVFAEDEEFDGLTIVVEAPSILDAEAMVAKMDALGHAGLWPAPDEDAGLAP